MAGTDSGAADRGVSERNEERNVAAMHALLDPLRVEDSDPERPYLMSTDRMEEYREWVTPRLNPEVEVDLSAFRVQVPGLRERYLGMEGWWEFWATWLEGWDAYRFAAKDWQTIGDHVIYELDVTAAGRQSGVPVAMRVTQVWSFRDGKLYR